MDLHAGTPSYIAPEQVQGGRAACDHRSDIYSLGMTAIQFLTGHYPLHLPKDEAQEVIWRDLASISDRLAAILDRMTRVDETCRYDCTLAVLADLETLPPSDSDHSHMYSDRSLDAESSHQQLTNKIMAIAVLIGLGLVSTAAVVSRVQSPAMNIGGESLNLLLDTPQQ